jgi:hypothetical protein
MKQFTVTYLNMTCMHSVSVYGTLMEFITGVGNVHSSFAGTVLHLCIFHNTCLNMEEVLSFVAWEMPFWGHSASGDYLYRLFPSSDPCRKNGHVYPVLTKTQTAAQDLCTQHVPPWIRKWGVPQFYAVWHTKQFFSAWSGTLYEVWGFFIAQTHLFWEFWYPFSQNHASGFHSWIICAPINHPETLVNSQTMPLCKHPEKPT